MSADPGRPADAHGRTHPARRRVVVALVVLLVSVLATAQAVLAWAAWQRDSRQPAWAEADAELSVLLVNGQVYYGRLSELDGGYLRLRDVYYVQALATGGAQNNQLVNRSKTDWHGPQWMAVPLEKIVFVEGIGPKSRLAELIEQERKLPPARP